MSTAAYLRKSKSDDPAREVSRDVQEEAVRRLAEHDGLTIDSYYVDWDRSADEAKSSRRVAFNRLVRDIESGGIDVVYAFAPDRLYRSLEAYVRLMGAADKAGTRIVTPSGAINGDGSPAAEFAGGLGALLARMELSTAKQRAKAAHDARAARGDDIGQAPYGQKLERVDGRVVRVPDPERPVEPVLDAFRRAGGKPRAAVRILNDELRLPAPYGGLWDRTSVIRIVQREAPELLPPKGPTGRREAPPTPALLAKLLLCPCGRLLTPNRHVERRHARETTTMNYYCARGHSSRRDHPRVYVSERAVLPFVREEADRYEPPRAIRSAEERDGERKEIVERRELLALAMASKALSKERWQKEDAELVAQLDALDNAGRVVVLPDGVDWSWPTTHINAVLRSFLSHIVLDANLRPVRAEWLLKEWRRA